MTTQIQSQTGAGGGPITRARAIELKRKCHKELGRAKRHGYESDNGFVVSDDGTGSNDLGDESEEESITLKSDDTASVPETECSGIVTDDTDDLQGQAVNILNTVLKRVSATVVGDLNDNDNAECSLCGFVGKECTCDCMNCHNKAVDCECVASESESICGLHGNDKKKYLKELKAYNKWSNVLEKKMAHKEFQYFHNLAEEKKNAFKLEEERIVRDCHPPIPLKFKILDMPISDNTKAFILSKIRQYNAMSQDNGEYYKLENWISGLDKIPFGQYIDFNYNHPSINTDTSTRSGVSMNGMPEFLMRTYRELDASVFGQADAKNKIVQIVAKLMNNRRQGEWGKGNVIGLKGPKGIGKTSLITRGLSRALNIPTRIISLGGANDSSFLNGHNYTWEGSSWGRIAGILMETGCMNPIIFFDELDKVGDSKTGEQVISMLIHLTDSSQNDKFEDKYFAGIDLDLSRCIFIFSFNDEALVNPILLDRITVVDMNGFTRDEKVEIAHKYLLPEICESVGFNVHNLIINKQIMRHIISKYCEGEQGVRRLKQMLETIVMKINLYSMLQGNPEYCNQMNIKYQFKEMPIQLSEKQCSALLEKEKNDLNGVEQAIRMMYL